MKTLHVRFAVVGSSLLGALALAPVACSDAKTATTQLDGPGATGGDAQQAGAHDPGGGTNNGGSLAQAGATTEAGGTEAAHGGAANASGGATHTGGADLGAAGTAETTGGSGSETCAATVKQEELAIGTHVTECMPIDYATNPPSSGLHYGTWAAFGVYDFPLPQGYWVHNLEHGAVVVTYNCPAGCTEEVAQASAWLATLQPDAACAAGPARVLLVPDPKLNVRWAASSWGFTLRADCFDAAAFTDFYTHHAGQAPAPEIAVCSPGADFSLPDANTCGAK